MHSACVYALVAALVCHIATPVNTINAPSSTPWVHHEQSSRPNVLYIVVDDLRPELPFYGQSNIAAPHLSALANRSLIFDRAYCQQPVCSPSRNSFMSGRRPSHTRIWNFISDFRAVGPTWTTLPSHFKANGYMTLGTGRSMVLLVCIACACSWCSCTVVCVWVSVDALCMHHGTMTPSFNVLIQFWLPYTLARTLSHVTITMHVLQASCTTRATL